MLDAVEKEKLLEGYDKETFNYYARLLLAPDSIRPMVISQIFVSQLQSGDNYFDSNKMLKYLSDKFPNSEYIPIVKKLMINQNINESKISEISKPVILNELKINSLKDLTNINGIKGNYIYIDLWSVYCMPCKIQFQYKDELHKLLTLYKNLVQVYISVDDESENATWNKQIKSFNLSGFHLRASKALYRDIQNRIYKNYALEVPRYLLLDSNGNIMNSDLPRPDAIDKLKEVFDNLLIMK